MSGIEIETDDPLPAARALVPVPPERIDAESKSVAQSFWRTLRRAVGPVPFAEEVVAAYYCALDPSSPSRVRAILLGALAYFIVPTDMIPDFIAGLGFTDDASVLLTAIAVVGPNIRDRHRRRARTALERPEPAVEEEET